jgi:ribosomal protein S18 acetylase RimI-like enzyme
MRSYRKSDTCYKISRDVYDAEQHTLIDYLIHTQKVDVACPENDDDQICGWICHTPFENGMAIHFCYVKSPFRRLGIGTRLIENAIKEGNRYYTHHTWLSDHLSSKHDILYNPYVIWRI